VTPADAAADAAAGPRRPEGRYGPARRPADRRVLVAAALAVVLVLVAWFAWVAFGPGRTQVHFLDLGAQVVDDTTTTVTFEVQKQASATAVCTVRALNAGFAEVGLVDVRVGPGAKDAVTVTATVRTSERAVSGNVKACALA
jgi:hypothetical protein